MVTMGVSSYNDVEFGHSSISENRIYHIGVRFVAAINQHVVTVTFHKSCISLAYINTVLLKRADFIKFRNKWIQNFLCFPGGFWVGYSDNRGHFKVIILHFSITNVLS